MVYSGEEVGEEPSKFDVVRFKASSNEEFKEKIGEYFYERGDDDIQLEYFDVGNWKKVTEPSDVAGDQIVNIRDPKTYLPSREDFGQYISKDYLPPFPGYDGINKDETYRKRWTERYGEEPAHGYGGHQGVSDPDFSEAGEIVKDYIDHIVEELKDKGCTLSDGDNLISSRDDHTHITIRDYILQKAQDDYGLQECLVANIGAIDHMVDIIRLPFTWQDEEETQLNLEEDDEDADDNEPEPPLVTPLG